jgi:hypothetical protein
VIFLSVSFCPSVIKNIITDGFTDGKGAKKKLYASFRWHFSQKNTVCNSIGNYLKIFFKKFILQNYKIIKLI